MAVLFHASSKKCGLLAMKNASSVAFKLSVSAISSVVLVLLISIGFVSWQIWDELETNAERYVDQIAAEQLALVETFAETARNQAIKEFSVFKKQFTGKFSVDQPSDNSQKNSPVIRYNGLALNGSFSAVDEFSRIMQGSVATIFAATNEGQFLRVSTSLLNQSGERAVGTLLDKNHPAFGLIEKGETYIG